MGRSERRRHVGIVAHVGGIARDRAALRLQPLQRRIDARLRARQDGDSGAGGGEALGDAEIDAALAAGDEHGLAAIIEDAAHLVPPACA
jgi:hypothetical protein